MDVAAPALAAAGDDEAPVEAVEVEDQLFVGVRLDHGAGRDLQDHVVAVAAGAFAAAAGAGLVGLPNAGKSTLISRISNARPKIADYPFTTLFPNLGVVDYRGRSMVVADIPGLLEGAHRGEGMGLEFLRHVERTRVLLFVIDVSPYAPLPPLRAFQVLRGELERHQPQLLRKKTLVLANKIDLLGADRGGVDALRNFCRRHTIPYVEISALTATNLDPMKKALFAFHDPA